MLTPASQTAWQLQGDCFLPWPPEKYPQKHASAALQINTVFCAGPSCLPHFLAALKNGPHLGLCVQPVIAKASIISIECPSAFMVLYTGHLHVLVGMSIQPLQTRADNLLGLKRKSQRAQTQAQTHEQSPAQTLTHSRTHALTHSRTRALAHSRTHAYT